MTIFKLNYQMQKEEHPLGKPHSWAKGFVKDGKIVYHPYTRKGFKFESTQNLPK